jgi:aryl-alcohol dehydrogenase-like predicted oxidoreductase
MTWGEQNTETDAHQQMDYAVANGVNFFDTAELYAIPPKEETYGETERCIGTWFNKRGKRDDIILATKVVGRSDWLDYIRGGRACLDRKNIEQALNASLKRLQTDYIDLYQLHWPDRNTNFFGKLGFEYDPQDVFVPIEETLGVMNDIIASGKVRYFGLSNETPWGTMSFLKVADEKNYPRPVSIQNPYSLLNRTFEIGLSEISHRENIGLLAYSPLGFGVLSGKYLNNAQPENARLTLFDRFDRYSNPQALKATEAYVNIARQNNLNPAQMALAYVNTRTFLTSNIIGATSMAQLKTNIDSVNIHLDDRVVEQIESVHTAIPNPSP